MGAEDLPAGAWRSTGSEAAAEETMAQLREMRRLVQELGHEIKPGSRLYLLDRHFSRFAGPDYDARRDANLDPALLAHGARDLSELLFICQTLRRRHEEKLREVLPTLLSGAAVPVDAPSGEAPRNCQFELLLAAQLVHSGFDVALEEPDVVFALDDGPVGIAVKRVTSGEQLMKRVKEGVEQISRTGHTGLVAVSLDRLLPPTAFVVAGGEAALDDSARSLLARVFVPRAEELHAAIQGTPTSGFMASMCVVGCVKVPWQPAHTTATWWFPRDDSATERPVVQRARATADGVTALRARVSESSVLSGQE